MSRVVSLIFVLSPIALMHTVTSCAAEDNQDPMGPVPSGSSSANTLPSGSNLPVGPGSSGVAPVGVAPNASVNPGPPTTDVTFADVDDIIDRSCVRGVCHIPEEYNGIYPNLTNFYDELHDTLTSTFIMQCEGSPLVDPGNPANSAIVKLPQRQCPDLVMPDGCLDDICLVLTDLDDLTAWIADGARK